MIILAHKRFRKQFKKLSSLQKEAVRKTLRLFALSPFALELENHVLKGNKQGLRSLSAGFDLRILYFPEQDHIHILLLSVGSHSQLYG